MLRRMAMAMVFLATAHGVAWSQEWANKMFETTFHDFGTVAKGAKTEFEFTFKNIYMEDIHVADVHASCTCTTPVIKTPTLKTYEKGVIQAIFNTGRFTGARGATLTVTIDKPYYAVVQLQVKGYIRGDVMVTPGSVEFGSVDQGKRVEKTVSVNYAGRDDWSIVGVKSGNPHLAAKAVETSRGGGQVSYNLVVQLDEKNSGRLHRRSFGPGDQRFDRSSRRGARHCPGRHRDQSFVTVPGGCSARAKGDQASRHQEQQAIPNRLDRLRR